MTTSLEVQERTEKVRMLTKQGFTAREISVRLGISMRHVCRHRNGQVKGREIPYDPNCAASQYPRN